MIKNIVRFTRLREEEPYSAPSKAHTDDAGWDLTVSRYAQIFPGQNAHLCTNIAIEVPPGVFGVIAPRSSTLQQKGLHVSLGVIDAGYRGEVMVLVRNLTDKHVFVHVGDRVAQLLVLPRWAGQMLFVQTLSKGSRGDAGFGSTGS